MTKYAPYVSSYTVTAPYITPDEYKASPTGVNVSQLVPRGTEEQNLDALKTVIARASSYADQLCRQILAATTDIQSGRYRVQRGAVLRVPMQFSPTIAVNKISIGYAPSAMAEVSDLSNVWIDRKVVTIPIGSVPILPTYGALAPDNRMYCIIEYVNGWANALLSETATAGSSIITVDNPVGMTEGVQLTIFDAGKSEVVYVDSVVGNVVTLTAPLAHTHLAEVNVSAFPDAIKQAVVLLTSYLIKTRGGQAMVMASIAANPTRATVAENGANDELAIATDLLAQYLRTV